jgi:hypothetical protein
MQNKRLIDMLPVYGEGLDQISGFQPFSFLRKVQKREILENRVFSKTGQFLCKKGFFSEFSVLK